MRTIKHPDVEISEIDVSQVAPAIAGTTCLVAGFSDRGEENEPFFEYNIKFSQQN